jgi:TRAP transporter TAXI family solute receptor
MDRMRILPVLLILLLTGGCGAGESVTYVRIGTGAVTGLYYPTGGAIASIINARTDSLGIKATVESTAGSVYNVNALVSGDLEFGVVQSDRQYQAWHGQAEWQDGGPQSELRSIFSIHPEAVTLIVSVESGIHHILQIRDRRINLGNPGSGPLGNARDVLATFGIAEEEIYAEYVKAVEAPGLLQDERIDGFFYTVGHPNGNILEATSGRIRVRLIPLESAEVDEMVRTRPYYTHAVIPIKHYPNAENEEDVLTFGVRGTFVTTSAVDEGTVYAITREIFADLENFRALHPAYTDLTVEGMLSGLTAPLHPGAHRYYEEAGLLRFIDPSLLPE